MRTTVNALVKLLMERNLTIAFAESMTCGLLAHQMNTVKGTSEILKGSIVCYHEHVKTSLMKVKKTLIEKHTAESQKVTDALARNLSGLMKADIHAAVTGLASPSDDKNLPAGTVFFSLYYNKKLHRLKKKFRGTPLEIKRKACKEFYDFIYYIIA